MPEILAVTCKPINTSSYQSPAIINNEQNPYCSFVKPSCNFFQRLESSRKIQLAVLKRGVFRRCDESKFSEGILVSGVGFLFLPDDLLFFNNLRNFLLFRVTGIQNPVLYIRLLCSK